MGFRINTNIGSMSAHRNSYQTNLGLDKSLGVLSSGLRINRASDDASGMAIADAFRLQTHGLGQAISNANDGIGLVQTADSSLDEYIKLIGEIKTKAIQAASDNQTSETRKTIQSDIDRLLEEAQNIANTTSFSGITLLNGGFKNKSFHIGAYSGETVKISVDDSRTDQIGKFAMTSSTGVVGFGATTGSSAAGTTQLKATITLDDGTTTTVDSGSVTVSAGINDSYAIAQSLADAFNAASQADADSDIRASVYETASSTSTAPSYSVRLDSSHDMSAITLTESVDDGKTSTISATATANLSNNLSTVDVTTRDGAEKAIITADYALKDLDAVRSDIGSVQSQLESTIRNISVTHVNVQAAESNIRDVDFASESVHFAKLNILAQSGSYSLSQANTAHQSILRLLQ